MNTKFMGGAEIGNAHASWPLAQLTVSQYVLMVDAGIIGSVAFRPQDVVSVKVENGKLSIRHRVENYNQKIFFSSTNASEVMKQIQRIGFMHNPEPVPDEINRLITAMQQSGVFPIKKSAAIAIILIWNILMFFPFIDMLTGETTGIPFQKMFTLAPAFMLIVCVLLLVAPPVQRLILKEGRSAAGGLRVSLVFMIIILTVIFLGGLFSANR